VSLITVLAGKGSPGATTTALALATVWPRPVVLAECDPSGGDLPLLFAGAGLSPTVGVVSLAAAARLQSSPALNDQLQLLNQALPVFVGPSSAAQFAALSSAWPAVIEALSTVDADLVVDCGGFRDNEVTRRLLAAADASVLVCRPTLPSVAHAREVLIALGRRGDGSEPPRSVVGVAVVGTAGEARDVEQALASHSPSFVTALADEPGAARALCGGSPRRLERSRLLLDARVLARLADGHATSSAGQRQALIEQSSPVAVIS
jgi:MinD-like ATPase involved in chromosome partitioning or flagellar assembly